MAEAPRVVVVTRPTEYEMLLRRHATREAARFFLATRGQAIEDLETRHRRFEAAEHEVLSAVPSAWRLARVRRDDLDRFLFEPDDVVVALGQDGLVPNVAKYLAGQLVIGIDPEPGRNAGVLVRHAPTDASSLFAAAVSPLRVVEERTLAECVTDDGQRLGALNEVFLGHRSHQTARYVLRAAGGQERQFSSGMIVATGTGATGWARSISRERGEPVRLPEPAGRALAFLVREAFPSPVSGTSLTSGWIAEGDELVVTSEMDDGGAIFGDGIEDDRVEFGYGVRASVRVADERLRLLLG